MARFNNTQLEKNLWLLGFSPTLFSAEFPAQLAEAEKKHELRLAKLEEMKQDPVWAAKIAATEAMAPERWLPFEALVSSYNARVRFYCDLASIRLSTRQSLTDSKRSAKRSLAKGLGIGPRTAKRLRDAGIDLAQFEAAHMPPKPPAPKP